MATATAEKALDVLTTGGYTIDNNYINGLYGTAVAKLLGLVAYKYDYWAGIGQLTKGGFFITIRELMEGTNLSRRSVQTKLREMEEIGLIEVIQRGEKRSASIIILTAQFFGLKKKIEQKLQVDHAIAKKQYQAEEKAEQVVELVQQAAGKSQEADACEQGAKSAPAGRKICAQLLQDFTNTKNIQDDDIYNSAPARESVKADQEDQEQNRKKWTAYSDALEAMAEKIRDVLLWKKSRVRKFQRYLIERTDWSGVLLDHVLDDAIAQLNSGIDVPEHYLAECFANGIVHALTPELAAMYTADRRRVEKQIREQERQDQGVRKVPFYNWLEERGA